VVLVADEVAVEEAAGDVVGVRQVVVGGRDERDLLRGGPGALRRPRAGRVDGSGERGA